MVTKGHFPLGGIFRAERHFLLFKDQLAESGRQNTKENILRGKFRLVENDPNELYLREWNTLLKFDTSVMQKLKTEIRLLEFLFIYFCSMER